jgi:hypothetical protein
MNGMKKIAAMFTPKQDSILHSRLVLYSIFILALGNLYMNLVTGDIWFFIYFGLVSYVTSFFSKNMVVILVFAMAFTNVLKYGVFEGFVGKESSEMEAYTDLEEEFEAREGFEDREEFEEREEFEDSKNEIDGFNAKISGNLKSPPINIPTSMNKTTLSTSISAPDPKITPSEQKALNTLKNQAEDLLSAQQQILGGFEKISPYMDRAEKLIKQINTTAETIQNMGA